LTQALEATRVTDAVRRAADQLHTALETGVACAPVRDLLADAGADAAYEVQEVNTQRALQAGRRLVGRKIGITSLAVQQQLGVNQPDFGMLFADMLVGEGLPISQARVMQPRIEAEIALILERDLTSDQPTLTDLLRAVAYVVPAFEIVGSRIANWDIRIVDTIADNASSGLFVLGGPARRVDGVDLRATRMEMKRGDTVVSHGSGGDCLGHPLNAAVWLAGEMARRGRALLAGDVVLTGALGPMVTVNAGDRFEATMSGIGGVTATFA
jgi:2-keto-4-pentenoate hydratase